MAGCKAFTDDKESIVRSEVLKVAAGVEVVRFDKKKL